MIKMTQRGLLFLVALFLIGFSNYCPAIEMPGDDVIAGWHKAEAPRIFSAENLYGYINGGAEIFLEFGFSELTVQRYQSGELEISVECYQMSSDTSALGMYLVNCGLEKPDSLIFARNTANTYQAIVLKNDCLIYVNNISGSAAVRPAVAQFANHLSEQLPLSTPETIFNQLPLENRVAKSERLLRGQYALQPVYTFGFGDIFLQKRQLWAVMADYQNGEHIFSRIQINYPDAAYAQQAFQNVVQNLDSYHHIHHQTADELIFEDYQQQFSHLFLKGAALHALIHLNRSPPIPDVK